MRSWKTNPCVLYSFFIISCETLYILCLSCHRYSKLSSESKHKHLGYISKDRHEKRLVLCCGKHSDVCLDSGDSVMVLKHTDTGVWRQRCLWCKAHRHSLVSADRGCYDVKLTDTGVSGDSALDKQIFKSHG